MTLKSGLGVTEGHWKCHLSIQRMRLSIDVQYYGSVVSEIFNVEKNVVTLKSGSEVIQGH